MADIPLKYYPLNNYILSRLAKNYVRINVSCVNKKPYRYGFGGAHKQSCIMGTSPSPFLQKALRCMLCWNDFRFVELTKQLGLHICSSDITQSY